MSVVLKILRSDYVLVSLIQVSDSQIWESASEEPNFFNIHKCLNSFSENKASGKSNFTIFFFYKILELLCLVPQYFNKLLIMGFINFLKMSYNVFLTFKL